MLEQDNFPFDEIPVAFTFDEPFAPQDRFTDVSHIQDIEETEQVAGLANDQSAAKPRKWWAKPSPAKTLISQEKKGI